MFRQDPSILVRKYITETIHYNRGGGSVLGRGRDWRRFGGRLALLTVEGAHSGRVDGADLAPAKAPGSFCDMSHRFYYRVGAKSRQR